MKKYTMSFLLVLIGLVSWGQDIDQEAKSILDAMKTEYDNFKSVEIDFELNIEIPERAAEIQKGKIIQKGNNFKIDLDDQSIYCNGESVWVHLKSNKEVQINDFEEDSSSEIMSPQDILSVYESGEYSYMLTNEQREDGKTIQQIEFKPIDRDSEYSKMRLTLIKGSKRLKRVKIFAKDGSRFTMSVNNILENKDYKDATFVFDTAAHPGVHVEDLRL